MAGKRLAGKSALVTGAARGTGERIARLFVAEGASVVLADILDENGEKLADELGSRARYEHLDVRAEPEWEHAVHEAEAAFGPLDILVNNAAILHMAAFEDTTKEDIERLVAVNQIGPFLGMKAVVPSMKAHGGGSIVTVTSIDSMKGKNGIVAYASSKWGARGITKVAALELGRYGIRVNAVCPEAGSPDMVMPFMPAGLEARHIEQATASFHGRVATQRERSAWDRIDDVAKMVLFLASDDAASCSGADFVLDNAITAGTIVRGAPGSD